MRGVVAAVVITAAVAAAVAVIDVRTLLSDAGSEWRIVGWVQNRAEMVLIGANSIRRPADDVAEVWTRQIYDRPQPWAGGGPYQVLKQLIRVSCGLHQTQVLYSAAYDSTGAQVGLDQAYGASEPIIPGAIGERVYSVACLGEPLDGVGSITDQAVIEERAQQQMNGGAPAKSEACLLALP